MNRRRRFWIAAGILILSGGQAVADDYRAGLFRSGLPTEEPAFLEALTRELTEAGYHVETIDDATLCDVDRLAGDLFDLVVLPDASTAPGRSMQPVARYLEAGGDIIALNAPLWQQSMIKVEGQWVSREDYQKQAAGELPDHVVVDFAPGSTTGWQRHTNPGAHEAVYETLAAGPAAGRHALHVVVSNFNGWDIYHSPKLKTPFPPGHELTVFAAKGSAATTQLAIEWREADGSRWVAVVPLADRWQQYVLTPRDFAYWQSNPKRGKDGDRLDPAAAVHLSVGVSFSHTGHSTGRHEYWVGPIGTAGMNPVYEQLTSDADAPPLDILWPAYKFFDSNGVGQLNVRGDQAIVQSGQLPTANKVRSPHPRPRGAGFNKGRSWRWIPLVEATDHSGEWRGTPAAMRVSTDEHATGGIWASFGITDHDWYRQAGVLDVIGQTARAINRGVFILDGGANYFTCFEDQPMQLGLRAVNRGKVGRENLIARVTLVDRETGKTVWTQQWPMTLPAGDDAAVEETFKPRNWPKRGFKCVAELIENDAVIDRVEHDVHVWRPKKQKRFVTTKDGNFQLDGQRWRAHGINYMPSSGVGAWTGPYFECWLGAMSYDPEVIERDLKRVKALGFNALSVFIYHHTTTDQNLLDLLRLADELDFKVNLSLRPGTPMDFLWPEMREIIEYYRLADNDTVFAYDLAWEPSFRQHTHRKMWDGRWEAWIVERYGDLANAEKDWDYPVPRDDAGKVTNPSSEQIESDGQWRRMVAAYRRFLDTLLYEKYSRARRLVRGVDPNHMVSFRMWEAGNPTFKWDGILPYDFPYLAAAVDILEPEAYGRIGDWERVKPGWFTCEYARHADASKPFIWAEMGFDTWSKSAMTNAPERLASQAVYYRDFYRMMIASGVDGVFFWWYPGGFRVGEDSDFGIINPDGTDRAVTDVIRQHAQPFLGGHDAKAIDHWIEIDRDARANGLTGVYEVVGEAFWKAIDAGEAPGLRTAGTGTTSANCPLVAVGNTPCNGSNPPKYLDAFFDEVEIRDVNGKWVSVGNGDNVTIAASRPVAARISLTNLGEAEWIASQDRTESGAVFIVASGQGTTRTPIRKSVPHLASLERHPLRLTTAPVKTPTRITISLSAQDRAPFGQKFAVRLVPRSVDRE